MQALSFGAILAPAFADLFCEVLRALTRVAFQSFNQAFRNGTLAIDKSLLEFRNGLGEELIE